MQDIVKLGFTCYLQDGNVKLIFPLLVCAFYFSARLASFLGYPYTFRILLVLPCQNKKLHLFSFQESDIVPMFAGHFFLILGGIKKKPLISIN